MAEVYHNNIIDIDLESGTLFRSFLNHTIGSGDNNANWYGVRVFRKGEPIALSGCSVQGLFMPASGAAILISDGTHTWVSGNEAAVLLPQACYNVKGQFTLTIKIIGTNSYSITDTVRIIDGVVADTYSENPVAPTAAVPTYQEILAVYDQMVAAKDGSVRFDIDQTLTAAQMTQARGNIAAASESDVSDLKSAFSNLNKNAYNELTSGLTQNASTYFDFYMFAGKTYVFKNTGASGQIALATRYDRSGSDIETINSSLAHGASYEFTPQYDTSILRVFCNAANGSFSVYQKGTSERRLIKAEEDIVIINAKDAKQDKSLHITEIASGYVAIQSITATKQQYINTGINYDTTTGFEVEFEMYSDFGQAAVMGNVLGSRISSGSKDLELNTFNSAATGLFRFGTSSAQKAANIVRNTRIRCTWVNNVYTVLNVETNTVLHSSTCTNANTADNGYPIFLFALNNGGTATGLANMKLYYAKLYSGSTVVANFVPAYNKSTGKTGLYDTVRSTFYGDANGGDFDADYGLALQVKFNTEDIDDLKNGTGTAGTVYETELSNTIEAYQTVLTDSGIPMLTIPIFTDLHHDTKYANDPTQDMMANIHALINYLHCDGLWNLGDAIDGQNQTKFQAETALSEVINKMYAITDRSHNLEGNHDSNVQSTWSQYGGIEGAKLTLPELYDSLNKGSTDEVHDFTTRLTNYYVDFDEYDIRVVCLGVDYVSFTIDTKTWLENVALNTNKKVVVLAHCPTRPEWGYNNDVQNGVAYIETPLKTFVNNGGKVLVYIHGHTHGDKISTASDLPFAEISIGCAKYEKMSSGTEGATYQDRNANDETKILFDLVCVDQTSKKVHFIRYGAGSDRYVSYD